MEVSCFSGGQGWIRTTEGKNQQIYSLPHLATLVLALFVLMEPMEGVEPTTSRLQITRSSQLSYIGNTFMSKSRCFWDCKDSYFFVFSKTFSKLFLIPLQSIPQISICSCCLACGMKLSPMPKPVTGIIFPLFISSSQTLL